MTASARLLVAREITTEAKAEVDTLENSKRIQVTNYVPQQAQTDEWIGLVSMDTSRTIAGIGGHSADWVTEIVEFIYQVYTSVDGHDDEECWDRIDELTNALLKVARKDRSGEASLTAAEGSGITWWVSDISTDGPMIVAGTRGYAGTCEVTITVRMEII